MKRTKSAKGRAGMTAVVEACARMRTQRGVKSLRDWRLGHENAGCALTARLK